MADGVTQAQFEALEKKVDAGFAGVDAAFADQRAYTDHAFEQLRTEMHEQFARVDERFAGVDGRLARLERKLDQFIDTQSKANELAERRLRRLESRA